MIKDKPLRNILFGKHTLNEKPLGRSVTISMPAKDSEDIYREISFAGDDGLILALIKRIEALENKKSKN